LIVGQVALALVLLVGAGLMVRSVIGMLRVNPGYDPHYAVHVSAGGLLAETTNTPAAMFARYADAQQRIIAIPGVIANGYSFKGREMPVSTAAGSLPTRLKMEWIGVEEADPLRVLRVPLKRGRWLERSDMGEGVPSVLINETAARLLWPGQEAVGRRFRQSGLEKPSASDLAWLRDRGFDTAMIGRP
jgi:hypothetical protein